MPTESLHTITVTNASGVPQAGKHVYCFKTATPPRDVGSWYKFDDLTNGDYEIDIEHANLKDNLEGYDFGIWDAEPNEATLIAYSAPNGLRNKPLLQVTWIVLVQAHLDAKNNPHETDWDGIVAETTGIHASATLANLNKLFSGAQVTTHYHKPAAGNVSQVDTDGYYEDPNGGKQVEHSLKQIGDWLKTVPGVPENLAVTLIVRPTLYAKLVITWDAVGGATSYDVKITFGGVAEIFPTTNNKYTHYIDSNGTYTISIRSRSIIGHSAWIETPAVIVVDELAPEGITIASVIGGVIEAIKPHSSLKSAMVHIANTGIAWENVRIINANGHYDELQAAVDNMGDITSMLCVIPHGSISGALSIPSGKMVGIVGYGAGVSEWMITGEVSGRIPYIGNIKLRSTYGNATNLLQPQGGIMVMENLHIYDGLSVDYCSDNFLKYVDDAALLIRNCYIDVYKKFLYVDDLSGNPVISIRGCYIRSRIDNCIYFYHGTGTKCKGYVNHSTLVTEDTGSPKKCIASNSNVNVCQIGHLSYAVAPEAANLTLKLGAAQNQTCTLIAEDDLFIDVYPSVEA